MPAENSVNFAPIEIRGLTKNFGAVRALDGLDLTVREAARLIAEDERLTPALVPLGDGLLAAVRD